jgi:hypothetical protein
MLVSTGVFFNRRQNTRSFREQWLEQVTLQKVVNFTAVRKDFFRGADEDEDSRSKHPIAPFAAVVFENNSAPDDSHFAYWSAKETAFVKQVQAVILNRADLRIANQEEYKSDDTLWKVYWWGGHQDEALIRRLRLEPSFQQVVDPDGERMRVGFQEASRKDPAGWLRNFMEFRTEFFERYGRLPKETFVKPPTRVHRRRERSIYEGPRLLIKRGIDQDEEAGGQIAARFETEPFCFRDSNHCAPLAHIGEEKAKALLAILWSSLTRYYLFLTSGTWGLWHDEVKKDVLYSLPVRFPKPGAPMKKLVKAVDALRELPSEIEPGTLDFSENGLPKDERDKVIQDLERKLDEAVFELFDLSEEEKDRIEEVCGIGLDFFYHGMKSEAVAALDWPDSLPKMGRAADLQVGLAAKSEICQYLATFIDLWDAQLKEQQGQFRWRVIRPVGASTMLAAIFQTETAGDLLPDSSATAEPSWLDLLNRLGESSRQPTLARRVYIDGLVRVVTDTDIDIVKRNERRLWTKSSARDDAQATMLMALELGEEQDG